jgi:hypothetical protein
MESLHGSNNQNFNCSSNEAVAIADGGVESALT